MSSYKQITTQFLSPFLDEDVAFFGNPDGFLMLTTGKVMFGLKVLGLETAC